MKHVLNVTEAARRFAPTHEGRTHNQKALHSFKRPRLGPGRMAWLNPFVAGIAPLNDSRFCLKDGLRAELLQDAQLAGAAYYQYEYPLRFNV
jgi:hypothetical protein